MPLQIRNEEEVEEELLVDEAGSSNGKAEVGRIEREETMSDGDGDPDSLARKLSSEAETAKENAGTVESSSVASGYAPVHRDRMGTIERIRSSSPPLRVDQADARRRFERLERRQGP
ncbi:hypothetical protein B0T16DRAFT_450913 [Cercophora newfieldiana]|uniref:Uncharacterized protein n=1 Tax=Cercophora newfieldiana TaxID=92897 RepID=A0AA39YP41_9PEZI|nr:hypothetical protein B0T16DRAFT_450913 [Cercophora newfieldiana]